MRIMRLVVSIVECSNGCYSIYIYIHVRREIMIAYHPCNESCERISSGVRWLQGPRDDCSQHGRHEQGILKSVANFRFILITESCRMDFQSIESNHSLEPEFDKFSTGILNLQVSPCAAAVSGCLPFQIPNDVLRPSPSLTYILQLYKACKQKSTTLILYTYHLS